MFLQGKNFELAISQKTFAALSDTARRMAVSEFIVMFSVFAKLLATKSRAHDFTIGTAVNARTERQIEPIIGMIVNTVPVRVRVKDAEPFEALCRETQTSLFKTLRYQDVPLSLIVRRLGLGQKRGYNPIFQHCFSFHDADVPSLEFGDTRGQITEAQNQASKFDINVVVIPPSKRRGTNDARMFWQFSSEAFLGDEGPQLAGDYIQLLHDVLMRD
jgi:non-ribosomal peptide synthetase component F